jgi:thiol:disulfide interchange protein DsbC
MGAVDLQSVGFDACGALCALALYSRRLSRCLGFYRGEFLLQRDCHAQLHKLGQIMKRSVLSLLFLAGAALAQERNPEFEAELVKRYPYAAGGVIEKSFGDFYSVVKGREVLYVNSDYSIMISGNVFDLNRNVSLTQNLLTKHEPKLAWSEMDLTKAIRIGNGAKKLVVFSDPDCPYCQKLEHELVKLPNVTLYIAPFPLTSLHPNAAAISERIWCSKDQGRAWRDYLLRQKEPMKASCPNPIAAWQALAQKYQINSTPTMVLEDGRMIAGAFSAERIQEMLGK